MCHQSYDTVSDYAETSWLAQKSRFIGCIMPCVTEQQAIVFIEQQKKRFWSANHHCYAYLIRADTIVRCSDDGEPQGTAGAPMLEVLHNQRLADICLVVTRYFGGVLLGTGGLVRAYTRTAQAVLQAADIKQQCWCEQWELRFDYGCYGKITHLLSQYPALIQNSEFGEQVRLDVLVHAEHSTRIREKLGALSGGRLQPTVIGQRYGHMPLLSGDDS